MNIEIFLSVLATGILGLLGWFLHERRQNYVARKSVKIFLIDVIKPVISALKDSHGEGEKGMIDKMIDFVDLSKGDSFMKLSYYPLFNTNFFQGFPQNRLRLAHGNRARYVALLEVIGYLDGFQGRMPHEIQRDWVDFINEHQKECKTDIKLCRGVRHETMIFQSNLESTRDMAEKMLIEINKVIS
jgi:hypothetical protein